MSYLCRDWTPTVDDPVVECHMPAGKVVRIELEIAKLHPAAAPTLLLQAVGWNAGPFYPWDTEGAYLWDVTESAATFGYFAVDPDPRHHYFRAPTLRHHALYEITPYGSARVAITFDPSAGTLNDCRTWATHDKPWLLRIGCPKKYTGMVTPLGSVITCRWEILDSKGGPT